MPPQNSYILSGRVFASNGTTPSSDKTVIVTNERTGETLSTTSNVNGEWAIDCSNFPSGYSHNDYITYTSSGGGGTKGKYAGFRVICYPSQRTTQSITEFQAVITE